MITTRNKKVFKIGGTYAISVPVQYVRDGLIDKNKRYRVTLIEEDVETETLKKVGQTAQSDAPVALSGSDVLPAFFDIASRFPVSFVERGGV